MLGHHASGPREKKKTFGPSVEEVKQARLGLRFGPCLGLGFGLLLELLWASKWACKRIRNGPKLGPQKNKNNDKIK